MQTVTADARIFTRGCISVVAIVAITMVSRNTAPAAPAPNIGLSGTKRGSNGRVQSVNACDASASSMVSNGASKSW